MVLLKEDGSEQVVYDYPDYPMYVHRNRLSSYANFAAPSHWHADIELIYIDFGAMRYNINGTVVSLQKGEGLLVNARQVHFGFSDTHEECEFLCILLHPQLLCISPAYERDFVFPLLSSESIPFIHFSPSIPWQQLILEQMCEMERISKTPAAQLKIQSAFLAIWALLFENLNAFCLKESRKSRDLSILKTMIRFIQHNYKKRLPLADIAASGAIGQSKCCQLFARYVGQTPNQNVTQYRINQSIRLLKNSDMSIIEIAGETGFASASYFSETFRKWTGKSPTEYRKMSI